MIQELNPSKFHLCNTLLNMNGQLEVIAIVRGLSSGRIFVDNTDCPKTALLWQGNNDGFFFIGEENNDIFNSNINTFIDNIIREEAKVVGLDYFECMGNNPKWNSVIEKLFEQRNLASWDQFVFTLHHTKNLINDLEQSIEIVSIKDLIEDNSKHIINKSFVHNKLLEFWTSMDDFYNSGIGFCAILKDVIVSICLSSYVVDNVHCVGIETLDEYRGRGYALATARAFANECKIKHYTLYWDCMKSNIPSVKLAKHLGCDLTLEYKGYYFKLE